MTSNSNNQDNEIPPQDIRFGFECLRNIDGDGKVDLGAVGEALGYSNVNSVGNRFRELRKRYGFTRLECKTGSPTKAKAKSTSQPADATPTKRPRGRPPKKTVGPKDAKPVSDTPTSATKHVVKTEEKNEAGSEPGNIAVEVRCKKEETTAAYP
ncbi:uncharacterized protein BJX67DRAFT_379679 [Aspergillus lucknowensis]|uniref:Myb-like DNA-binding domain-containing protein n=1 Tax=Aspergillus lucknowensis TaxID=176173 RepID=A0ABR4LW09_9EURO